MEFNHSIDCTVIVNPKLNDINQLGGIQLSVIVPTEADDTKTKQESKPSKRVNNRGLIFQKTTLVFMCVVIITFVWALFFALIVVTFDVNQDVITSPDPFDSLNTSLPQTPVAYVRILNIFNDPILDLYLGINELVLSNNGIDLVGNVTIPVAITMSYHYLRYDLSYFPQVTGVPRVYFNPSFVQFNFSAFSVNNSVVNISSISSTSFASFSSNQIDTLNITVQCPEGFSYSDAYCRLRGEFCDHYHPSGDVGRIILRVGLVLFSVLGFIVSMISLLTFALRICIKSELAGASESTFCKRLFSSLLTPSLFTLYLFAFICLLLFMITDLPNPDSTYCNFRVNTSDFVLFDMYGGIFHFFFIGFLFWANFTLFNLLLILSFPYTFVIASRMKYYLFFIELIIGIAVPLSLVILSFALRSGNAYRGLRFIGLVVPVGAGHLWFIHTPLTLACALILTLTPLIICKMRWNNLRTIAMVEKYPKANPTPIEYRIAIYSCVIAFLLIILMTGLIFYFYVIRRDGFFSFVPVGLCTTYHSPALLYRAGFELRFSSSAEALMAATNSTSVPLDFIEGCDRLDLANSGYPPGFYVLDAFLLRILISCIFIITLPTYKNYQAWQTIFSYGAQMGSSAKVTKH